MASLKRVVLSAALVAAGCQPHVATRLDRNAAVAEVRARSSALVAAENRKDLEAIMPFWAADAIVHTEGVPAMQGHAEIRRLYGQFFPTLVNLHATITDIHVAHSGDFAYETGANHFTFAQGGGEVKSEGKYLAVWQRGADGLWRLVALAVTNDQPPAAGGQ